MKKTSLIFACTLVANCSFGQQFELRLTNNGDALVHVQMREISGNPPENSDLLSDLVFAICWDVQYNIDLMSVNSDYTIEKAGPEKTMGVFEYQQFAKTSNPMSFPQSWNSGDWVTILQVANSQTATQTTGNFFLCPTNIQELNINYNLVDMPVKAAGNAENVLISGSVSSLGPTVEAHTGFSWNINPNPNNGRFDLLLNAPSDDEVQMMIYDAAGSLVYQDVVGLQTGENRQSVRLNQLQAGVYQVQVVWNDGYSQSRSFVLTD